MSLIENCATIIFKKKKKRVGRTTVRRFESAVAYRRLRSTTKSTLLRVNLLRPKLVIFTRFSSCHLCNHSFHASPKTNSVQESVQMSSRNAVVPVSQKI
jgi:hypothetical protein